MVSAFTGELDLHILLIIPVISISGPVGIISILISIIGGMMILFSVFGRYSTNEQTEEYHEQDIPVGGDRMKIERGGFGGVIFLGPFPIVFGDMSFKEKMPGWISILSLGLVLFIIIQLILMIVLILI